MIPLLQLTVESNMNIPVFDFINSWDHKILQILFGMVFGLFIQQVILSVPKFKLTASIDKVGTWLASFSYTLYLVHVPLMYLFQKLGAQRAEMLDAKSLGWFILYLVGGLLGSYIIYFGFERNTSKVKRFLYNRIDKKTIYVC